VVNIETQLRAFYDNFIMRDILGYFIPGAIVVFYYLLFGDVSYMNTLKQLLPNTTIYNGFIIIVIYVVSYLIGHISVCISYYIISKKSSEKSLRKYINEKVNSDTKDYFEKCLRKSFKIKNKDELTENDYKLYHDFIVDEAYRDEISRLKYLRINSLLILNRNLSVSILFVIPLFLMYINPQVHDLNVWGIIAVLGTILTISGLLMYRSSNLVDSITKDTVIFVLKNYNRDQVLNDV